MSPKRLLALTALLIVGGLLAVVVQEQEQASEPREAARPGGGEGAPRQPAVPADRDATLWPFAADSPWNMPIGDGVAFEDEDGPMTVAMRAREADGQEIGTWINSEQYSIPVVQASTDDPLVFVDDAYREDAEIHVPVDARAAEGTDGHLIVIRPDGRYADEFFALEQGDDGWTSERHHVTDLHGTGLGPQAGVRAYGGSALGGLIRRWEVDPSHPEHQGGAIRHALAVALPEELLRYEGGESGYDAAGFGTARGYVWPATEQDYDSPYGYSGTIPMGTLVAIPPDVDLDALGLEPELHAIATALQDYGAYVVDRAYGAAVLYAEPGVPEAWLDAVRGPNGSGGHLDELRQLLRVVTNNGPDSLGGGGEPRAPLAPPFRVR